MSLLISIALLAVTSYVVSSPTAFNIKLVFVGNVPAVQQQIFNQAAARWQEIITTDIGAAVVVPAGRTICGQPPQAANLLIDDLLIFAQISAIDGPGRVLGRAGPCAFDRAGNVRVGSMQFDSADAANLVANGNFFGTVLHEMGHVLGVGSSWAQKGLVGTGSPIPYLGKGGIAGQAAIGGSGNPVIEDIGGAGTARVHWKETVYGNELMTGFISGNTQPLSALTAQSLTDLGYKIDVTKVDAFTIPGAAVTRAPTVAKTKSPTNAPKTSSPTSPATKSPTSATKAPTNANGFNIEIVVTTPGGISPTQQAAFDRAVAKWTSVITGDIGNTATVRAGTNICGQTLQQDLVVDDVVIFADISPIDGAGRILGQAGPCAFDNAGKVRLGSMQFDSADVASLEAQGTLDGTILHEMGHVLGIGTQWEQLGLLTPTAQPSPVQYLGTNGNIGQTEIGGSGRAIVEDIGGPGTARGHWKEAVYGNELMTGFLSGNTQPMSRLTVQALKDLGYTVDLTKADAFTIPKQGRRLRGDKQEEDRSLEEAPKEWESHYPGEVTWGLETESKAVEDASDDDWEVSFQGVIASGDTSLENAPAADAGAIAGGVIGGLAFVGAAAAFVVYKRRSSNSSPKLTTDNPQFDQRAALAPPQQQYPSFNNYAQNGYPQTGYNAQYA